MLEGFHPLKHALRFGANVIEVVCSDAAQLDELAARLAPDQAERLRSLARETEPAIFAQLAPLTPTTGVIALAERPAVDAAVAALTESVRERVVITGGVSDAGRVALLAHAHVLAYPSLYEGFGFPVLEAMSIGVPVVAARAGSIPEVAGDAATLVGPTDVGALADALTTLVDDDAARAEHIALGRDQARRFSWIETAHGLAALYRRMANA